MDDQFPHVFSPFRLGGFDLRNRLVALPAGTSLVERGIPTHGDIEYFERLASGGVGLIIAGATVVHPTSALRSGKLVEGYLDAVVPAMAEKADAVHRHGARLVGQLCHLGREFLGGESDQPPMAPSPIKSVRDAYPPHELTLEGDRRDHRRLAGLHGEPRQGRPRRRRDPRGPRLPARPVPVTADQPAVRRLRRLLREPDALPAPGRRGDALRHPGRIRSRSSGSAARRRSPVAWTSTTACGSPRTLPALGAVDYFSITHGTRGKYVKDSTGPDAVAIPSASRVRAATGVPTLVGQRIRDVGDRRARHQGRPRGPGRHGARPDRRPRPAREVADGSARRDPWLPGDQPGLPGLRSAPALRRQRRGRSRPVAWSRCPGLPGPRRSTSSAAARPGLRPLG